MAHCRSLFAATLVLLAACQTDNGPPQSKPAAAAPHASSVAAAPIVPVAQSTPANKPANDDSRAGRLAAIQQEYDDAMHAYAALFKDAKTDEEHEAISKTAKRPDAAAFRTRARAIVDEDPADAVALDAITWMITTLRGGKDTAELLDIVRAHHMKSDKLVPLARSLASDSSGPGAAFVEQLMKESPHDSVRGTACYSLAQARMRDLDSARKMQGTKDEDDLAKLEKRYGPEKSARFKALDIPAEQARIEALLERTSKEFADVAYGKGTLGERANADLFEMRNLVVGKVAPDIEGQDLSGKSFRLADYRGKVVMLDFWGNW
jgi:hypothetical protein